jgi:hypothetical protein
VPEALRQREADRDDLVGDVLALPLAVARVPAVRVRLALARLLDQDLARRVLRQALEQLVELAPALLGEERERLTLPGYQR